jgi:propionyl-CoA synthetase
VSLPTASDPTSRLLSSSRNQPDAFWTEQARSIDWAEPFTQVCDFSHPPFARWFVGGRTNLCHNAVDRHLVARGDQPALHFISTETDETRILTYRDLHREVVLMAATLRSLGLKKGDRVILYLPMIPEAAVSMLACARLGLVHSAVFAGFAAPSLANRIDDAGARVIITCDAGLRGGKVIPLKRLVDDAVALAHTQVAHVLVIDRRIERDTPMTGPRDLDYASASVRHASDDVPCVWLESNEPSYLLYTSGTTARPKGIQRDTGGYAVALAASLNHIYDGRPGETYFSTADVGWVVGHSYTVYGPLIQGMTTVIYEGLPTSPDGAIWWKIASDTGASVMFSSPTAIRVLKKQDPALIHRHDLGRLRYLFLAGEPLDEPTSTWIREALGHVTIIDNYWQTETGWPILTLMPGAGPVKVRPGSPGFPAYGYHAKIVDPVTGHPVARGEKGILALGLPLPPGCMTTIWRNDDLFAHHYCGRFSERQLYSTFDYAVQDADGYYFILGRSDDVINVAGHRLGTREIEEAVSSHPAVAETATIGKTDELKGQAIVCFVVLKYPTRHAAEDAERVLKREIEEAVVSTVGALARPALIVIVRSLPKTRSGKIVRRALLALAEGRPVGDVSTMEDTAALDEIGAKLAETLAAK